MYVNAISTEQVCSQASNLKKKWTFLMQASLQALVMHSYLRGSWDMPPGKFAKIWVDWCIFSAKYICSKYLFNMKPE